MFEPSFYNQYTLPETNIFAPENGWLEDDPASFRGPATVRGRELLVSGRVMESQSMVGGI